MDTELYQKFYDVETKHWWFSARRKIILEIIKKIIKLKNNSMVLDYGCGTGGILDLLSENYNSFGADMSELAIEFCKKRKISNVMFISEALSRKDFKNKFDMVTLLDVIEHIEDDKKALENILPLLKEDGCLLITVPAHQFLYGPYDVLTQHKRRYSKKTLISVLNQAGFKIETISFFNFFLSPLMVISRLISTKTGSNNDTDIPNNLLNSILRVIFEFEKYLLPYISFPFGISILCIAKKR